MYALLANLKVVAISCFPSKDDTSSISAHIKTILLKGMEEQSSSCYFCSSYSSLKSVRQIYCATGFSVPQDLLCRWIYSATRFTVSPVLLCRQIYCAAGFTIYYFYFTFPQSRPPSPPTTNNRQLILPPVSRSTA
jgi:hypothetical protein